MRGVRLDLISLYTQGLTPETYQQQLDNDRLLREGGKGANWVRFRGKCFTMKDDVEELWDLFRAWDDWETPIPQQEEWLEVIFASKGEGKET